MIDSTNPRIMANNIRELGSKSGGTTVEGNPSGTGYTTLLTKLKIGTKKYKLPAEVTANPEGEASSSLNKLGIGSGVYSVGGSASHSYSTTEVDTGETWINGEHVYEKTIYSAGGTSGSQTIAHAISNLNQLIGVEAVAYDEYESGAFLPLPKIDENGYHIGITSIDSTNITYFVPTVYVARITKLYITLRYTKTESE